MIQLPPKLSCKVIKTTKITTEEELIWDLLTPQNLSNLQNELFTSRTSSIRISLKELLEF